MSRWRYIVETPFVRLAMCMSCTEVRAVGGTLPFLVVAGPTRVTIQDGGEEEAPGDGNP
jgi:hypothetical protein